MLSTKGIACHKDNDSAHKIIIPVESLAGFYTFRFLSSFPKYYISGKNNHGNVNPSYSDINHGNANTGYPATNDVLTNITLAKANL